MRNNFKQKANFRFHSLVLKRLWYCWLRDFFPSSMVGKNCAAVYRSVKWSKMVKIKVEGFMNLGNFEWLKGWMYPNVSLKNPGNIGSCNIFLQQHFTEMRTFLVFPVLFCVDLNFWSLTVMSNKTPTNSGIFSAFEFSAFFLFKKCECWMNCFPSINEIWAENSYRILYWWCSIIIESNTLEFLKLETLFVLSTSFSGVCPTFST